MIYSNDINEFMLDGKLYIETIDACTCTGKRGDLYSLECQVDESRTGFYYYSPDSPVLWEHIRGGKGLWLLDKAEKAVSEAIDEFEDLLMDVASDVKIRMDGGRFVVCYRQTGERMSGGTDPDRGLFRLVVCFANSNNKWDIALYEDCTLEEFIVNVARDHHFSPYADDNMERLISRPTMETLAENPLYSSAVEKGNDELALRLKWHYRLATYAESQRLAEMLKWGRVLPPLRKEYDRDYYVTADTVDLDMLKHSDYGIWHRPDHIMANDSRKCWSLNPHCMFAVDAAPAGAQGISFQEYLEMFDSE